MGKQPRMTGVGVVTIATLDVHIACQLVAVRFETPYFARSHIAHEQEDAIDLLTTLRVLLMGKRYLEVQVKNCA